VSAFANADMLFAIAIKNIRVWKFLAVVRLSENQAYKSLALVRIVINAYHLTICDVNIVPTSRRSARAGNPFQTKSEFFFVHIETMESEVVKLAKLAINIHVKEIDDLNKKIEDLRGEIVSSAKQSGIGTTEADIRRLYDVESKSFDWLVRATKEWDPEQRLWSTLYALERQKNEKLTKEVKRNSDRLADVESLIMCVREDLADVL
jgi:hypothetical protein